MPNIVYVEPLRGSRTGHAPVDAGRGNPYEVSDSRCKSSWNGNGGDHAEVTAAGRGVTPVMGWRKPRRSMSNRACVEVGVSWAIRLGA